MYLKILFENKYYRSPAVTKHWEVGYVESNLFMSTQEAEAKQGDNSQHQHNRALREGDCNNDTTCNQTETTGSSDGLEGNTKGISKTKVTVAKRDVNQECNCRWQYGLPENTENNTK